MLSPFCGKLREQVRGRLLKRTNGDNRDSTEISSGGDFESNRLVTTVWITTVWKAEGRKAHDSRGFMRHRNRLGLVAISVALAVSGSIAYRIAGGPTSDEFTAYAAFFFQLSADGVDHVALADRTSKLVAPTGESWTPVELRP